MIAKNSCEDVAMVFGRTPSGENIVVVYDELDHSTVYSVTAYPVED